MDSDSAETTSVLYHEAYAVERDVFIRLVETWSRGSKDAFEHAVAEEEKRRKERAKATRVASNENDARALAKSAAEAFEEHLCILLQHEQAIEDVQRLDRFAKRSINMRVLDGPAFLLYDIGASVASLVADWHRQFRGQSAQEFDADVQSPPNPRL
jgi:hypothetical protein